MVDSNSSSLYWLAFVFDLGAHIVGPTGAMDEEVNFSPYLKNGY